MSKRVAVIVTGSRKWPDEAAVYRVLDDLSPDLVIHGAAAGADECAQAWAESCDVAVVPMFAQWDTNGRAAGPMRNNAMVDVGVALRNCGWRVLVAAFPLGESRGTRHCMRVAGNAGFEVRDFSGEREEAK